MKGEATLKEQRVIEVDSVWNETMTAIPGSACLNCPHICNKRMWPH
jgi:hypothetical protein